jgi:hypothetical protein
MLSLSPTPLGLVPLALWLPGTLKLVLAVNLTKTLNEVNGGKEIGAGGATFLVGAHVLGNANLIAQRPAKSTIDGSYQQFMHTMLWIIQHPQEPTR